jgi:muramoyltetrapeptide carboxypeptidase LdcA involved in peptidoglycan recycling
VTWYHTDQMIIPAKLKPGDTIAVIAPSLSLATVADGTRRIAEARFNALGLEVVFGAHVEEAQCYGSCHQVQSSAPALARILTA